MPDDPTISDARPPRASVIIAAKDAAGFIETALRSALAQTLSNVEVIVVNDGSTDDTGDQVRRLQAIDQRILLIDEPVNQGVSAARNRAVEAARGDWVAILDADDEFAPTRLERLVDHAERNDLDLLADNLELREFPSRRVLGRAYPSSWMGSTDLLTLQQLLERDWPNSPHKMFGFVKPIVRRSFLVRTGLRYDEEVWCAEDFLFYARALLAGANFGVVDEPLYFYAQRLGSASHTRTEVFEQVAEVNRILTAIASDAARDFLPLLQQRQAALDYQTFSKARKQGHYSRAWRSLRRVSPGFAMREVGRAFTRRLVSR